jgi:hypothetical protein
MHSDVLHVLVRQLDWKLCVKSNLDGDDGRSARWRNLSAHAGRPVDGSESEFCHCSTATVDVGCMSAGAEADVSRERRDSLRVPGGLQGSILNTGLRYANWEFALSREREYVSGTRERECMPPPLSVVPAPGRGMIPPQKASSTHPAASPAYRQQIPGRTSLWRIRNGKRVTLQRTQHTYGKLLYGGLPLYSLFPLSYTRQLTTQSVITTDSWNL